MLKATLAVLLCSTHTAAEWVSMGKPAEHSNVTAISMSFDFDTFPSFAYGYNVSQGRTNIPVLAWNGTGWVEEYHRESQFAQGYHDFTFKVRNNVKYLGLKIHYRFGSVLNGAIGYRGSYAFHNQLFDYEIDANGDMFMLWISEAATTPSYPGTGNELVTIKYPESAWASYPAANHFDAQDHVADQTNTSRVTDVKMVPGATKADFYGAYVLGGEVHVFNDTKTYAPLGGHFPGVGMDLTYSAQYGVILSSFGPSGDLEVHHLAKQGAATWVKLGESSVKGVSERLLKTHVSVSDKGVVVVAAEGERQNVLKVATYNLEIPEGWTAVDVETPEPITHWEMGVGGNTIYVVYSENAVGVKAVKYELESKVKEM